MNTQGIPLTTISTKEPLVVVEQDGVTGKSKISEATKTRVRKEVSIASLIPEPKAHDLISITAQSTAITIANPVNSPPDGIVHKIN